MVHKHPSGLARRGGRCDRSGRCRALAARGCEEEEEDKEHRARLVHVVWFEIRSVGRESGV